VIADIEVLRRADRFRFANVLSAWMESEPDGTVTGFGYSGRELMGSTTVAVGALNHRFEAVSLPLIQQPPEVGDGWVRFTQTAGGRTGLPAPRRVRRRPFIQWQAPLVWSTLSLTLRTDGPATFEVVGASRFPRHWFYDEHGRLASKSGMTDFKDWYRKSFGRHTPWGDEDSPALVTAVETALERALSARMMRQDRAAKPAIRAIRAGKTLVEEGDEGTDVFLVLDGVVRIEKGGERLAEFGPGAVLGERAGNEDGARTSSIVAVTDGRVAAVPHAALDPVQLHQRAQGHRREESGG
jgi:hypothetical protein